MHHEFNIYYFLFNYILYKRVKGYFYSKKVSVTLFSNLLKFDYLLINFS
ncbi:hypothetical protein VO54_01468 [Elizabethkingia miricola]|nr:hypothetical protein VO54_01468 [Elizabethkingia miricola]